MVKKNIPLVAFCLYFAKLVLQPATLIEASILLILGSICCYFEFKSTDQTILDLNQKVTNLENAWKERDKDIDNLKSSVASVKLGASMRPLTSNQR